MQASLRGTADLTHSTSFYWDRTLTATNMIWLDTKRDTLALPSGDSSTKGIVSPRATWALTKRDLMNGWSHEKVSDISIESVMQPLSSRVHLLTNK